MAFDKAKYRREWLGGLNDHAARALSAQMKQSSAEPAPEAAPEEDAPDIGVSAMDLDALSRKIGG